MKLIYRPEIDGLRAIAVVSVILYHFQISILDYQTFSGGFIGVDIFFVISGYLITLIILKELVTTGKFSFKFFYERRIRRLIPLLLVVIIITIPFALYYLLPNDLMDYSKSIIYSLFFGSNFYFHHASQQYGAESAFYIPFLHTWSLSIEEQYYLLFPVILILLFKYLNKYLIYLLIFGFVFSLFIADWGSRNHPSFNFYILPARGWELLAGSILAYFEVKFGKMNKNNFLNIILPSIGLFLICHSIIFFNDEMFHPSFYTLSPVIGTCLIIWFANKKEFITQILSSKIFVGVGLISYSLYLWHYPILVFYNIMDKIYFGSFDKLALLIAILFLSILSYFYIEKPSRNKKYKFRFIFVPMIFISFMILVFNLIIIFQQGFKNRYPLMFHNDMTQNNWNLLKNEQNEICHNKVGRCIFNSQANNKIFIIGDSFMGTIMFDLKNRVLEKGYSFTTSTKIGCLYFPGFDKVNRKTNEISNDCNNDYFTELQEYLNKQENSIMIFGGELAQSLTNEKFFYSNDIHTSEKTDFVYKTKGVFKSMQFSFKYSLEELSKKNKIILIYPLPEVGWNAPQKLLQSVPKNIKDIEDFLTLKNFQTTSFQIFKERSQSSFEMLDSLEGDNIIRVYPHKLFCNTLIQNRCLVHNEKNIFYSDFTHPSIKGSEMINDLIIEAIDKIENSK